MPRSPYWWLDDFEDDDDDDFDPPFSHAVEGEPPDMHEPGEAAAAWEQAVAQGDWTADAASEPAIDPDDTKPVDVSKFEREQQP